MPRKFTRRSGPRARAVIVARFALDPARAAPGRRWAVLTSGPPSRTPRWPDPVPTPTDG